MASGTGVRPMTLSEKLLCHNAVGLREPYVQPGQVIVVKVQRTLASEITLVGMKGCMEEIGKPPLWDANKFFLACDHSVDPKNYHEETIKKRIADCARFSTTHKLKDYFGPNESILHTEFYRQRAEPGTIIVGADSHSCSHGCVGAYAMGMGAADVTMPLVTGTTWLRVPETVLIEFTGTLPFGMVGKDVMLRILQLFRRNTIALDRCVEFGGQIEQLDIDSRFALSNMATEFGALAGIFPGDEVTQAFLERRTPSADAAAPVYLRADPNATYFKRLSVDISQIQPCVARWPSPDHVFAVDDPELGKPLLDGGKQVAANVTDYDGVFLGACTTTENEFVLAALVLEAAMKELGPIKQRPDKPYKRKITPGSKIMTETLEKLGILQIYRDAGFDVGAAGCSYCLGIAADRAQAGEVWLSSQNRNFRNRMGRGAIGNVSSACVTAVSSIQMRLRDPTPFFQKIDKERYNKLLQIKKAPMQVVNPSPTLLSSTATTTDKVSPTPAASLSAVSGRCQVFGDSVDTDAIIPAEFILLRKAEQGAKAFHYFRPEFGERVKGGATVVVAGTGFGCGSSREEAVSCLKYAGVQAIVAKSFSFIFGRNLLTLNLIGVTLTDERFYQLATEGAEIELNMEQRCARVMSHPELTFTFELPPLIEGLYKEGGVISMFHKHGAKLFDSLASSAIAVGGCGVCGEDGRQKW